jgi:prophage maintenance system killer protein
LTDEGYRLEAPEAEPFKATLALSTGELDEKSFASWLRESSSKYDAKKAVKQGGTRRTAARTKK